MKIGSDPGNDKCYKEYKQAIIMGEKIEPALIRGDIEAGLKKQCQQIKSILAFAPKQANAWMELPLCTTLSDIIHICSV